MLVYVHPISAALVIAFLGYVGSLALRARSERRQSRQLLAQHARLARILYALVLAVWAGGLFSNWMLRRDLTPMASGHFRVAGVLVIVLSGSVLSSLWMKRSSIRVIHPWLGIGAMLLAAAQAFFGLQILP
jgi:Protein of unknown function (DUF4079)